MPKMSEMSGLPPTRCKMVSACSADSSLAQWCADNQLTSLRLARASLAIGDTEFTCEQLGRAYRGTLEVRPTPNPNFRRVDARIANAAGQPVLSISTVLPR